MCHDNPVQFLCAVAQLVTDKHFIRYFMHLGVLKQDNKYNSGFWQKWQINCGLLLKNELVIEILHAGLLLFEY